METVRETASETAETSGERRGSGLVTTPPPAASSADSDDDNRELEVAELREELNHLKLTVATERRNQEAELGERDAEIARLTEQIIELKGKAKGHGSPIVSYLSSMTRSVLQRAL